MSETNSIEAPPGFVVREEAHKAAYENGFRIELGVRDGWIGYRSATARGEIWVSRGADKGSWLMSISHAGVAAELGLPTAEPIVGPGFATFAFGTCMNSTGSSLASTNLASACPTFRSKPSRKPHSICHATRKRSDPRWSGSARISFAKRSLNIGMAAAPDRHYRPGTAARLSHRPWAECETDALRLNVHNGLLLSALWDAAFDAGLVSIADNGTVLRSPELTAPAVAALGLDSALHSFLSLISTVRISPTTAQSTLSSFAFIVVVIISIVFRRTSWALFGMY